MNTQRLSDTVDVVTATPSDHDVKLLTETVDELYGELQDLGHAAAFDRMAAAGAQLVERVPELSDFIKTMAGHRSHKAAVLNFPVPDADLMPTPQAYREPADNKLLKVAVYRGLVIGLADWYAYGYTSQQPGNIVNDVIAIRAMEGVVGASANAAAELGLHNEDASYNLAGALLPNGEALDDSYNSSPDWLTLQFLRNPDRVPTFVAGPDFSQLDAKTLDLLHQPRFMNLTNPGQGGAANDANLPLSLLQEVNGDTWVRANTDNLIVAREGDPEAQQALRTFRALLPHFSVDLPTHPGCIVLIDNRRVLHGRRNYTQAKAPKWDGTDRWQQRVVVADVAERIKPFEVAPRIIDPAKLLAKIAARQFVRT